MATLTKKNETVVAPAFKNGVNLQFFQLSFPSTVAAKLDTDYTGYPSAARSPVAVALEAIAQVASIEIVGSVQNITYGTGQDLRIAVSAPGGNFEDSATTKWDGTNAETFSAYLNRLVHAAGTWQGVNLAVTTVTSVTI